MAKILPYFYKRFELFPATAAITTLRQRFKNHEEEKNKRQKEKERAKE